MGLTMTVIMGKVVVPCTPVPAIEAYLLIFLVLTIVMLLPPVSAINKLPLHWVG